MLLSNKLVQKQTTTINQHMQQSLHMLKLNNMELAEYLNNIVNENPFINKVDNENNTSASNNNLDNAVYKQSLKEYITEQIYILFNLKLHKQIAFDTMDELDEFGYLRENSQKRLTNKYGIENFSFILNHLKQIEPAGLFAIDIQECLKLQLIEKGLFDGIFTILLENLPLIANKNYQVLCKKLKLNYTELAQYLKTIKTLSPKPANQFSQHNEIIVGADLIMQELEDNNWKLEINNQTLPKLLMDKEYYTIIKAEHNISHELQTYCHDANNLINALNQRAKTLLKVAEFIINHQLEFFKYGPSSLKSLNLKEIAEKVGLHESTISRVCANKFILTKFGLLPLKYFLSKKIENEHVNNSSKSIKSLIKTIIEKETINNIYSDQEIAEMLSIRNIIISRRTIVKYRQEMNIPASNVRKNQLKLKSA